MCVFSCYTNYAVKYGNWVIIFALQKLLLILKNDTIHMNIEMECK